MLERLIHEPRAREMGQPLLTLSSLNKINLILIFRLTVRKWRPTVKNRPSLDRKRFSPEKCLKCTKGDFKWKKFENFSRSTSMLAYSAQNAPSVWYTIIFIHGVPTSFPVTSAGHGYWGLCRRSILPVEFGVEFCSFPLIYRWRLQSSFS